VAVVQYTFTHKQYTDTRWQQYSTHLHTNSTQTPGGAVQYTFTHKQYTEYRERNIHNRKRKNSIKRKKYNKKKKYNKNAIKRKIQLK
jgi:hypothetical protein